MSAVWSGASATWLLCSAKPSGACYTHAIQRHRTGLSHKCVRRSRKGASTVREWCLFLSVVFLCICSRVRHGWHHHAWIWDEHARHRVPWRHSGQWHHSWRQHSVQLKWRPDRSRWHHWHLHRVERSRHKVAWRTGLLLLHHLHLRRHRLRSGERGGRELHRCVHA